MPTQDDLFACRPRQVPRGDLMRFDLLRHTMTIHMFVREIAKLKFSKEHCRQVRNLLRSRSGLPLDPLDADPIN